MKNKSTRSQPVRRVTLADVAKHAGVSRVAVSEVVNNRPNCWASEATRQRIREAAIRDELARAGAPAPVETRLPGSPEHEFEDVDMLEEPLRVFFEAHRDQFDGLIGGDPLASLAIRLLHEMGRHVPGDVAVIGGGTTA